MATKALADLEAGGAHAVSIWTIALYGGALALTGQIGAAVRRMEEFIERCTGWGIEAGAFGHLVLGEIYLEVALRRPVPLAVIISNLGFLLRSWPLAHRRARRHLEEAARVAGERGFQGLRARCLLDLGLLCGRKRRKQEAKRLFDEAMSLATPLGAPALVEKIEAARSTLV